MSAAFDPAAAERPPFGAAAGVSVVLFAVYARTLAPTTAFWDTSEYITTAHVLGIPHPPGNPLFVALGRVWILLLSPFPLTVAQRVNLLAAATGAASFGFFFLVAYRILRPLLRSRGASLMGAAVAVLLGGTTYTVWSQSNVNEKVYTISLLLIAAVSWLALRWYDRRHEPRSLRYLLLAGYLMALGSTNHLMSVLPLPALAILVLTTDPRLLLRKSLWAAAVPLMALGLSFNFFLPIRAAQDPIINEGEAVCESPVGAAVAVYTMGRAGCPALAASLTREQYQKPPLTERQAPLSSQIFNWFQYFDWQWARGADPDPVPGNARIPLTLLFGGLALLGYGVVRRAHRPAFVYLGTLGAVLTLALVVYLNFEHGYSLAPEIEDRGLHEVRERDYFFIAGFALLGTLAGVGLAYVWGALARRIGAEGTGASPPPGAARGWLLASPVLALAFIPLAFNWAWADRSGDYAARDWAYDLLMSLEPYAVLFTDGDNDTFPLWYMQEVEGIRKDVTVIVGQYLYTDWYIRQLQRVTAPCPTGVDPTGSPAVSSVIVCQRPLEIEAVEGPGGDAGPAPAFLREAEPPAASIIDVPPEVLDSVSAVMLSQDTTLELGVYALTYPGGSFLTRGDLLVFRIIRDSLSERPVYFASRGGGIRDVALDPWGVRHGLATKLEIRPLGETDLPGVIRLDDSRGGEWIHLERSRTLVDEVYRYRSLPDRSVWPDLSTLYVPTQYYLLFAQLSEAMQGEDGSNEVSSTALRYREMALRFLTTARGGRVMVGPEPATAGP